MRCVAALAALLAGCHRPLTELVVVVDSDLCAPGALDRVVVTVVGPTGAVRTSGTPADAARPPRFPITVSVIDDGRAVGPVTVRAEGWRGASLVVSQQWQTGFVAGESRVLALGLVAACETVACGARQTCVAGGACVATALDPQSLADAGAALPERDGACVASPIDASLDVPDAADAADAIDAHDASDASDASDAHDAADASCDADLQNDPAHCGACGHACGPDVPCTSGACADQVLEVSGGMAFTCARLANQRVYCWGEGVYGEIGDGADTQRPLPVEVPGLTQVRQIAAGAEHVCALRFDGTVWCWGRNIHGECGLGTITSTPQSTPAPIPGLTGVGRIVAGSWNTCALLGDESVRCWGRGDEGQLGDGLGVDHPSPTLVPTIHNLHDLDCGGHHCCATDSAGASMWCWGTNDRGQVGDGSMGTVRTSPVAVTPPENVVQIATGYQHTCMLGGSGRVYCWGDNGLGQLGDGVHVRGPAVLVPGAAVVGLDHVAALVAGALHTCARHADGTLVCWGDDLTGQLGDGTLTTSASPVAVVGLTGIGPVGSGYDTSCAIHADGRGLVCWGDNSSAELGAGVVSSSESTPQPVMALP